jgi:hypothetical protein
MKNITVAVSDQAHRGIRIWAAEHSTSVSAILQALIEIVITQESEKNEIIDRVRAMNLVRARLQAKERELAAAVKAQKSAASAPLESPFRPNHSSADFFSSLTKTVQS